VRKRLSWTNQATPSVPELAVELGGVHLIHRSYRARRGTHSILYRRYEVGGWYGLSVGALKVLGMFAAVAAAARGFVAFGAWRTSLRNRLIGVEPHRQETR
jgi:hypothetical protein